MQIKATTRSLYCMLLIASISFRLSKSFIHLATATKSAQSLNKRFLYGTHQGPDIRPSSSTLLASDSSSVNGDQNTNKQNENKAPRTGWNHNLPSESSDFWEGPGPEKYKGEKSSNELKTGWLHNTKPAQQKQQQQRTSSTTEEPPPSAPTVPGGIARLRLELAMKQQTINHRIEQPPTFHPSGLGGGGSRGIVTTEHKISVPLFRGDDDSKKERIDISFSIVEQVESAESQQFFHRLQSLDLSSQKRAQMYIQHTNMKNADEMVLYLQGGPGFGAPTPITGLGFTSTDSSWAAKALSLGYKRIVLMDQRGTGRSSPVTKQTLEMKFPNLFLLDGIDESKGKTIEQYEASHPDQTKIVKKTAEEVTEYMAQFRADNIVWDAESIRETLLVPPNLETPEGIEAAVLAKKAEEKGENNQVPKPWGCSLGQSFGGFCSMTYLSLVKHPPKVMLMTGGIAPMMAIHVKDVYSGLWERVRQRNMLYYEMYPGDVMAVHKIVQKLIQSPTRLPSGGTLTARRFLQIGLMLGGSPSNFAALHGIVKSAFVDMPNGKPMSETTLEDLHFRRSFLKTLDSASDFDDAPFYFWMHETIYADAKRGSNPTQWAAHRAYEEKCEENDEFDYRKTSAAGDVAKPTLFFGEMVFPWMSDDYAELSGVGLKAVAELLAFKSDWPALYEPRHMRDVLSSIRTRLAAAAYIDDMFVDWNECLKVTAPGGPLEKCKIYATNEYQHSGLRDDGASIFAKIHGMALGSIRTPS